MKYTMLFDAYAICYIHDTIDVPFQQYCRMLPGLSLLPQVPLMAIFACYDESLGIQSF